MHVDMDSVFSEIQSQWKRTMLITIIDESPNIHVHMNIQLLW